MKIKGIVAGYSSNHVRYAIKADNGYTVVDLMAGDRMSPYDVVSGPLENHGHAYLYNHTTDEQIEVYVEAIHASQANAASLLRCI